MRNRSASSHVVISGILLVLLLLMWVGSMTQSAYTGSVQEQLQQAISTWRTYQFTFITAMLIAPAYLYFMVSMLVMNKAELSSIRVAAGLTIMGFYALLVTIAYGAQVTLVPYYLNNSRQFMAQYWFFFGDNTVSYHINQTGYALWAVSVLVLFSGMVRQNGIRKTIGILFILSAGLSLAAYAGLIFDHSALKLMTIPSGVLAVPISLLSVVMAFKKNEDSEVEVIE